MLKFTKMQGLGNDYVYIDNTDDKIKKESELAVHLSNRNFGIGADGLILICKSKVADFKMRIFNKDGTEAEMCGNGIRCVGKYVYDKKLTNKTEITIETLAGIRKIKLNVVKNEVETVEVDMGTPIFNPLKIPVKISNEPIIDLKIQIENKIFETTCISMGNPHSVIIVEDVLKTDVEKYGKLIEKNKLFPKKTNVEFVQILDKQHVKARVWERGTGETLACGTGACAVAVAGNIKKLIEREVYVELPGGILKINWRKQNNHVYMIGPAVTVFEGECRCVKKGISF